MTKEQGKALWNAIHSYEVNGENEDCFSMNNPVAHHAIQVLNPEIANHLLYDSHGIVQDKVHKFLLEWAESLKKNKENNEQ